jgi:hypothetical protein
MRKDCVLSKLTEEQQADLFDWLTTDTYDVVLKRIAQPPPKGFGIRTHINSLFRFYKERQGEIRARELISLVEPSHREGQGSICREGEAPDEPHIQNSSGNSTQSSVLGPQRFYNASQIAFAHSTYILAHSPLNPATYRAVSRTLHQHEDNALKREYLEIARQQLALGRERLQLDRTQFEYNAARAALALLPELVAVDQLNDIDDEAKIWRVRDRLFGSPSGSTPASGVSVGASPTDPDSTSSAPSVVQPQPDCASTAPSVVTNNLK